MSIDNPNNKDIGHEVNGGELGSLPLFDTQLTPGQYNDLLDEIDTLLGVLHKFTIFPAESCYEGELNQIIRKAIKKLDKLTNQIEIRNG